MKPRLDWDIDGRDWPNRDASRFVTAGDLRWHVQIMGSGPAVLLIHGTGASTHSWRGLAPLLARYATVVALDLPGHGFTGRPVSREGMSLPGMARAIRGLLEALGLEPEIAVGHSAGAAILARMSLDGMIAPRCVVSLNGALLPLPGPQGALFSPIAKLLATSSLVPRLFAWRASDGAIVQRLVSATGSTLEPAGVALYGRLMSCVAHADAALAMMASWDLEPLARDLPALGSPLILVVGGDDKTIAPEESFRVRDKVPGATVCYLRGLGHLAHEEKPSDIAALIEKQCFSSIDPQHAMGRLGGRFGQTG